MTQFWIPAESSGEIVPVTQLESAAASAAVARWQAQCEGRFPRAPGGVLAVAGPNAFLVEVLDGDYRYGRVGAELVKGFDEDFSGLLLSELTLRRPRFGLGLRMLYDMVRGGGAPIGYRGWVGRDMPGAKFSYHENAILPFGGDAVEQLMVITVLAPLEAPA
jgi:hypothetical protein